MSFTTNPVVVRLAPSITLPGTATGRENLYYLKLNSTGKCVWANYAANTGMQLRAGDITYDALTDTVYGVGDYYMAATGSTGFYFGSFQQTLIIGNAQSLQRGFLVALNTSTGAYLNAVSYGGISYTWADGVETDLSGIVYVTGSFSADSITLMYGGPSVCDILDSNGGYDIYITRALSVS